MNLYIDAGNSRIKWMHDAMNESVAADSLEMLAAQWQKQNTGSFQRVVGCSVRGDEFQLQLEQLADQCFQKPLEWQFAEQQRCGVSNAYEHPQRLGADRWIALIAVRSRFSHTASVVVDAGTAVTVDLIDQHGQHRGGVIMPGMRTMLDSLAKADRLFPDRVWEGVISDEVEAALATHTQDAILGGVLCAVKGGIHRAISQQIQQIGAKIGDVPIVLTGGDSHMLTFDELQTNSVPDLVLDGLRIVTECAR